MANPDRLNEVDGTPSATTGISEHDGKVLAKVKRRAYRFDMRFRFLKVRFGWSSVIGVIPGLGDVIDAFMALMILRSSQQIEGGLPSDVKLRMVFNIILDFGIGLVPFIGDLADALFRANTRNAVELERYLLKRGAESLKAQGGVHLIDLERDLERNKLL